MQILDIVTLCPEIEICYMGLFHKCFEIMEGEQSDDRSADPTGLHDNHQWVVPGMDGSDSDDDDDDDEGMDDSDEDDSMDGMTDDDDDNDGASDADNSDNISDGTASEFDEGPKKNRLKLREILFYTEKVEIFKVRNATL